LSIQAAHWANHVRPQRWAKNPPGKKERTKDNGHDVILLHNAHIAECSYACVSCLTV